MSTRSFTPHTIQPGWWKRWPRQALHLYFRSPIVTLFAMSMVAGLSFIQLPYLLSIISAVFSIAAVLLTVRVLDHHAHAPLHSYVQLFKDCWRDILRVARDLFVYSFAFTLLVFLLRYFLHDAVPLHTDTTIQHIVGELHGDFVLRKILLDEMGLAQISLSIGAVPIIYLSLSVGGDISILFYQVVIGFGENRAVLVANLVAMWVSPTAINTVAAVLVSVNPFLAVAIFAWIVLFCVTILYLLSREMFDGQAENEEKKARQILVSRAVRA